MILIGLLVLYFLMVLWPVDRDTDDVIEWRNK